MRRPRPSKSERRPRHRTSDTLKGLLVALTLSAVLFLAALAVVFRLEAHPPSDAHLAVLKFDLAMFKVLLAGFVVGTLGILVPAVLTETQNRFQQRKASRAAYSRAKTSIDYLKLQLACSDLASATAAIRQAHFRKHQAELYEDFPVWLVWRYGPDMTPRRWDLQMYGRLFAARQVLEAYTEVWDDLAPETRLALLADALPTEDESGGEDLV